MFRNFSYQSKVFTLVALLIALWWLAPSFLKRTTGFVFQEFQAPAWTGLSYLRDLRSYWLLRGNEKSDLIEAGVDLARLNAAYSLRNQQAEEIEREIERLEAFFNLPSHPQFRYEVARVVHRDVGQWWQELTIRKGSTSGIESGQAVVFAGGVVGRIVTVNAYSATVQLISSPQFRTAAHFAGDNRPVEFRGQLNRAFQRATGQVGNVPPDIEVSLREPARLISSRLGGTFPDGLTLGWVYALDPSPDGLFQSGKVRLDPRLLELREVAVLVPLSVREPERVALDP
jgi:rod shape-determining protein MreC